MAETETPPSVSPAVEPVDQAIVLIGGQIVNEQPYLDGKALRLPAAQAAALIAQKKARAATPTDIAISGI